jgi:hypothetical protein
LFGSITSSDCKCAAGYKLVAGVCTACPINEYKPMISDDTTCTACGSGGTTASTSSTRCTCATGYAVKDGFDTGVCRKWIEDTAGTCAAGTGTTCNTGNFLQGASLSCSTGTTADCNNLTPFYEHRPCFKAPGSNPTCITNADSFAPQYGNGGGAIDTTGIDVSTPNTYNFNVVVPSDDPRLINVDNALAVHVGLYLSSYLQTVKIFLVSPSGRTVKLFDTGSSVCFGFIYGAQLIFTDDASLPPLTCDNDRLIAISGDAPNTYIVRPFAPLTELFNEKMAGTWIVRVVTTATTYPIAGPGSVRNVLGTGITTAPVKCPANQYLDPANGLSKTFDNTPVCVACPLNSAPVTSGVNNRASCACNAGYVYNTANGNCDPCGMGTFRYGNKQRIEIVHCNTGFVFDIYVCFCLSLCLLFVFLVSPFTPAYQQFLTVCSACHSSTKTTGATNAGECMNDCAAGYEPIYPTTLPSQNSLEKTICRPCGVNSFKSTVGPYLCTTCDQWRANTVALITDPEVLSTANSNQPPTTSGNCKCRPGYRINGAVCSTCSANFYKDTVGDIACTACNQYNIIYQNMYYQAIYVNMCLLFVHLLFCDRFIQFDQCIR